MSTIFDTTMIFSKLIQFSSDSLNFLQANTLALISKTLSTVSNVFIKSLFDLLSSCISGATSGLTTGIAELFTAKVWPSLVELFLFADKLIDYTLVFLVIHTLLDLLHEFFEPLKMIFSQGTFTHFISIGLIRKVCAVVSSVFLLAKTFIKRPVLDTPELDAVPESFDTLFMSMFTAYMLPSSLKSLLRECQTLTNTKLLDDSNMVYDLLSYVLNLPIRIIHTLMPDCKTKEVLVSYTDKFTKFFPFSSYARSVTTISSLVNLYNSNNKIIYDPDFQQKFLDAHQLFDTYCNNVLLHSKDVHVSLQALRKTVKKLADKISYMSSTTRQEPLFVVFYGPAGTGKTTLMNTLVSSYTRTNTAYIHSSPKGDKDFYDQYDNEYLFVADDVGQKSTSQWSQYINMVSTTKFPLDCAAVEKKDTKFFTSKLIMITTNNINLTITPDCGLTTLEALHRRMYLIDFDQVRFDAGHFDGQLNFKTYDLRTHKFKILASINLINLPISDIVKTIDLAIRHEIAKKKILLENAENFELEALPESGSLSFPFNVLFIVILIFVEIMLLLLIELGHFDNYYLVLPILALIFSLTLYIIFSNIYDCIFSTDPPSKVVKKLVLPVSHHTKKDLIALPESLDKVFELPTSNTTTSLTRLKNNTFGVSLDYINSLNIQTNSTFVSVFSGGYFTAPYHACITNKPTECYVTVYSSKDNVIYDHIQCALIWTDTDDDIAIFTIPRGLPRYNSNLHFSDVASSTPLIMMLPHGELNLENRLTQVDVNIRYYKDTYANTLTPADSILHDFHNPSLCGSFVVTQNNFLIGQHIAYVPTTDKGVIRIFKKSTVEMIKHLFSQKVDFLLPLKRDPTFVGSVAFLDKDNFSMPNMKTTYVPSKVHGIFDELRKPAELSDNPINLMHTLSQQAHLVTETVDIKLLPLVCEFLKTRFVGFKSYILPTEEIIKGNDYLNRIDPTTSVGYGLSGNKKDYIDYFNFKFSTPFNMKVNKAERLINEGIYPEFYFAEQFKDELRDLEKVKKPRIFSMSPLLHTVLIRKYFGSMLAHFRKNRRTNGIEVGINPFSSDWEDLRNRTVRFGDNVFDGDFSKYDKKMMPMFQQAINKVILESHNFSTEEYQIAQFLLNSVMMTPKVTVGVTTVTTHSLPSGIGLTADYNSVVQDAYLFYVFCQCHFDKFSELPTIQHYLTNVAPSKYGDDCLCGVSDDVKDYFNGPFAERKFNKMGLEFTPGDKTTWNYSTRSIEQCTFLKRGFKFHHTTNTIVAPLNLNSIKSTLNFVTDSLRNDELTLIKLHNAQRELFLHEEEYDVTLDHILEFCHKSNFIFQPLTKSYLLDLYLQDKFIDFYNFT
jgi:GTPase SAR1 family protein